MSYYKDGQSPSPYWSSSPGQHPFGNYPTPSHQNNYFPSQQHLPALPGLAHPPPAGMHHHHGFVSHCNNTSPPASFINGSSQLQPALRSDGNGSSSGKTNLLGSYTTPSSTQQESSFAQVLLPTSSSTRKSSPYFSPPPPLPQVLALAVSPNDPTRQEDSTSAIVYRNSPYFSEAPNLDTGSGSSESSASSTAVTIRPVPAKSAFMCFSEVSGKAFFDRTGAGGSKGGFVEAVAAEWRSLSKQDKAYWGNMAKKEKTRFTNEKKAYKGPISRKLRTKKNPLAPKRPMSAFLMYAQQKRRPLQRENPDMPNADISRLLGELWRNASVVEKRPILEREEVERKIYKAKMEAFKNDEKFVKSMKTLAAAATMTGYAGKKVDQQRQDVASFSREELHSNQRYDLVQSTEASYPKNMPARQHQGGYADDQTGGPSYHDEFDASNWTPPTHNHQESGNHVKYTYPRPRTSDIAYTDLVQSTEASYPRNASMPARQHQEGTADDQAGSPSYHKYEFDASNWTPPTHNHQNSGNHVKYTYPRPREDHYK